MALREPMLEQQHIIGQEVEELQYTAYTTCLRYCSVTSERKLHIAISTLFKVQ